MFEKFSPMDALDNERRPEVLILYAIQEEISTKHFMHFALEDDDTSTIWLRSEAFDSFCGDLLNRLAKWQQKFRDLLENKRRWNNKVCGT